MSEKDLEGRILSSLNEKQRRAVTAPSNGIFQVVAGPGTGKTKVIVSRVAYLLIHEKISPQHIIVTTFTKKAANEMMERLREIFSGLDIPIGKLLIGTFHSICYRMIQKYGRLIDLEGLSIADEKDASEILSNVLLKLTKEQYDMFDALPSHQKYALQSNKAAAKFRGYDVKKFKRQISKAKSAGLFPDEYETSKDKNPAVALVYTAYQAELLHNKVLDFDDCLLYCYRIVSRFPVLSPIRHTLVDEFQDTNEIQLQLMYQFAKGDPAKSKLQSNVTIVGDPDQSIYAFRDAQSVNFEKMRDHYSIGDTDPCEVITLDENYRSTSDILDISEKIMRQQENRVVKTLKSQYDKSVKPMQAVLESPDGEARWITHQIEFLMGLPHALFKYSDFAVLVRSAYQTRAIENELSKRKIPYFMVRGKAFWDRKEVVAMVDYLRCVGNADDKLALLRCVNFPKRGFGPKTVVAMEALIDLQRVKNPGETAFMTLKRAASNDLKSSLGPKMRTNLKEFLDIIESTAAILDEEFDPDSPRETANLERAFDHLYKSSKIGAEFADDADSALNIGGVKDQLLEFDLPQEEESLPDFQEESAVAPEELSGSVYIKKFLESISLYDTDPGKDGAKEETPKVSLSTIHGSKGLEWPVVFVPGLSERLLPAYFALYGGDEEAVNEERRCFYVATTRAKNLLYISGYTDFNYSGYGTAIDSPSRFMNKVRDFCAEALPFDTIENLKKLYHIMKSQLTDQEFDLKTYYKTYTKRLNSYVKRGKYEQPVPQGFTTASKVKDSAVGEKQSKKKSSCFSASSGSGAPKTGSYFASASKAPAYTPNRTKPSNPTSDSEALDVIDVDSLFEQTLGVKRAPVYVPDRSSAKRRLGTK